MSELDGASDSLIDVQLGVQRLVLTSIETERARLWEVIPVMDALHLHEFVDVVMGHICRQLEFDETYTGIGEDYKGGQPFGCSHLLCSCSCSDWRSSYRRFVYCSVHYCIVHLDLRLSGLQKCCK